MDKIDFVVDKELYIKYNVAFVTVKFDVYSRYYTCTLERLGRSDIRSVGETVEIAINKAISLLKYITPLEKQGKLTLNKDAYVAKIDNFRIHYRIENKFIIISAYEVDENNFVILHNPKEIKDYKPIGDCKDKSLLEAAKTINKELYFWDDISVLSGSAGLAIAENGKIVKEKTVIIA